MWRARKNKIRDLTDSIGVVHTNSVVMGEMANEYFQNIFKADPTINPSPILDHVEVKVTEDDNARLVAPFSDKEI